MGMTQNEKEAARVAEGKCPHCGGERVAGRRVCKVRLDYERERMRARRARLRLQGPVVG